MKSESPVSEAKLAANRANARSVRESMRQSHRSETRSFCHRRPQTVWLRNFKWEWSRLLARNGGFQPTLADHLSALSEPGTQ